MKDGQFAAVVILRGEMNSTEMSRYSNYCVTEKCDYAAGKCLEKPGRKIPIFVSITSRL
jgi:hypothetical protein